MLRNLRCCDKNVKAIAELRPIGFDSACIIIYLEDDTKYSITPANIFEYMLKHDVIEKSSAILSIINETNTNTDINVNTDKKCRYCGQPNNKPYCSKCGAPK